MHSNDKYINICQWLLYYISLILSNQRLLWHVQQQPPLPKLHIRAFHFSIFTVKRACLPKIKSKLLLFSKDQRKNEPFHKKKYQKQCHRIDFLVNTRSCTATTWAYFTKILLPAASFWYPAIPTGYNTTSPRHNITMPLSIPLITKKLHLEVNAI